MITLEYSKIDSFLDNVPLTKKSRIEYHQECKKVITLIRKTVQLGYKTNGDIGVALKLIDFTKFKTNPIEYPHLWTSRNTNQLKTFLLHLGYPKNAALCILRTLKEPLSTRGKEIIAKLKDNK